MTYDVVVVGLGIIGACSVHALTRAGARVVGVDAGMPGAGTTAASDAWLNAANKEPEAYYRLNAEGMAAYRELARELGVDAGHHEIGLLEWADDVHERELRGRVGRLASRGYVAEFVSRARALAMEPGLAIPERVRDVAFYAADAWLDTSRLILTLLNVATAKGAEIRTNTPVQSFRTAGQHIDAVVIDSGEIRARSVLVCVGAATKAFLAPIGVDMPVDRVYGLLAITSRPDSPLQRIVHAPGVHLRSDAAGRLVLGANDNELNGPVVELASSQERAEIASRMLDRARVVFPAARDVTVVEYRVGVRPVPADGHTIAGRIPGFANAWMIATHSGVTLGALLGALVADEIIRDTPTPMLAPFRPDRFTVSRAPVED